MRTYVRRGRVGVSFGWPGTVALGFFAVLELAVLAAAAVIAVLAGTGAVAAYGAGTLIRHHRAAQSRAVRTGRHAVLPQGEWVYRPDRWPHAVRKGSWLDRR